LLIAWFLLLKQSTGLAVAVLSRRPLMQHERQLDWWLLHLLNHLSLFSPLKQKKEEKKKEAIHF
jgi:hypothetical protein